MNPLQEFNLPESTEALTEADLELELARRIDYMLHHNAEYLFSLLYRMDVSERKVQVAMRPDAPEPAAVGIARLVMERQRERNRTMAAYRPPEIEGLDEELRV